MIINSADSHMLEVQSVMNHTHDSGDGDVLAIVGFNGESDHAHACGGKQWKDLQLRMSSVKLKALGSSKINDMFEPRVQDRIQKRMRRRPGFVVPPGVEFILDFTPPTEGPELADLTAALWLPKMIKLWFLAGIYTPETILESGPQDYLKRPLGDKAASAILTLGHDDVCLNNTCLLDLSPWRVDPNVPGIVDEDPLSPSPKYIPRWRRIDDYCRIRHRVAVMRVLRAINGQGLLLNSATRMWTVAQVAIHLEVPQVVVDPVTQWLITAPNSKFIEICPERAFQLAYALKIPSVLIASFRILVSEHAVDYLATNPSPRRPSTTWAQRQRDDYGDFPSDPIEYASRAFADRISGILDRLQSDQPFDVFHVQISQWERLRDLAPEIEKLPNGATGAPHPFKAAYEKLVDSLISVYKRNLATALEDAYLGSHLEKLIPAQRKHYIAERDIIPLQILYQNLNDRQKALTSLFWCRLKNTDAFGSFSESTYQGKQLWRIAKDYNHELNEALAKGAIDTASMMERNQDRMYYDILDDFDIAQFIEQLFYSIKSLCDRVMDRCGHDTNVAFFLSDHLLLSLNENELNYLPIWADGLDDGSGGVFQEAIPPAEMGPTEPGPAYHTGYTVGSATETDQTSMAAPSDLGIGDLDIYSQAGSIACSMDAQQSVTTGPARHHVIAASDFGFESDTSSVAENIYSDARFAEPANHQPTGQALARYVEDVGSENGEDMAWSEEESVTGAGLEAQTVGEQPRTAPAAVTNTAAGGSATAGPSILDRTGNDDDMAGIFNSDEDDDDDDDTSTLDGSEFDWV
ncbi:hypothetical protein B0T16DRAFT_335738 [Cercophora newfieldiana]|uniref:Uncharacterized protein n=1 Tax=Cercophora newfieldiana TaxID=92897 RepID=A0AA39XWL6_9PEZI|nr:hypothetical protein B0T16DRAFT_335738 [Cercophora newfieldiana]